MAEASPEPHHPRFIAVEGGPSVDPAGQGVLINLIPEAVILKITLGKC
jgi:hypothetical protein